MIRGETLASGAPAVCEDCGARPAPPAVFKSPGGGWYIGTWCRCGPYSRESGYYHTQALALEALEAGRYRR